MACEKIFDSLVFFKNMSLLRDLHSFAKKMEQDLHMTRATIDELERMYAKNRSLSRRVEEVSYILPSLSSCAFFLIVTYARAARKYGTGLE